MCLSWLITSKTGLLFLSYTACTTCAFDLLDLLLWIIGLLCLERPWKLFAFRCWESWRSLWSFFVEAGHGSIKFCLPHFYLKIYTNSSQAVFGFLELKWCFFRIIYFFNWTCFPLTCWSSLHSSVYIYLRGRQWMRVLTQVRVHRLLSVTPTPWSFLLFNFSTFSRCACSLVKKNRKAGRNPYFPFDLGV